MFSVTNKQNDNTDSKKSNNPGLQLAVRCGAIKNSYGIDIIRDASSYKILLLCKKNNCVPELDFSLSHQALNKMRI